MCHCRACNSELNWIDLRLKQDDGSPEDFCSECRLIVNTIDLVEDKEYLLENAKEGVKQPYMMDHY